MYVELPQAKMTSNTSSAWRTITPDNAMASMSVPPETVLRGHKGEVQCLEFTEKDTVLLSGDSTGSVRVWNIDSARSQPTTAHNEDAGITQVRAVSDIILTQGRDGAVKKWGLGNDGMLLACQDVLPASSYHYCKFAVPKAGGRQFSTSLGPHVAAVAGHDNKGVRMVDWRTSEQCLSVTGSDMLGMTMCIELLDANQPLVLVGYASVDQYASIAAS